MADTMINMELVKADTLTVDSLQIGDLVEVYGEIVEVIFIESDSTGDNYDIQVRNDFGETEVVQFAFNDELNWYVYLE